MGLHQQDGSFNSNNDEPLGSSATLYSPLCFEAIEGHCSLSNAAST